MTPEDIRALLTDEWQTTRAIADRVPAGKGTDAARVQAVRRVLDSEFRFGMAERRMAKSRGVRTWEWRRVQ